MDASPLRVQSQDEIHAYTQRENNEKKRMPLVPKNSKLVPMPNFPNRDFENQDPGRALPIRPSRIPVLVKSLHPQTAFYDAQQEQRHLAVKAKKAKSCARPTPFNMSGRRSLKINITSETKTDAHAIQSENVFSKTKKAKEKPMKCLGVLKSKVAATKEKCRSHEMESGNLNPLKTENVTHQKISSSSVCFDKMTHLTLKDPNEISNPSGDPQDNLSKDPCDIGEGFQPNKAALLSIVCNEGVSIFRQAFATPQSKSDAMFVTWTQDEPQRLPVAKSHQKAAASAKERLKPVFPMCAKSQNSSRRDTFIDKPHRVPTNKSLAAAEKAMEFQPNPSSLLNILHNEDMCICSQSNATPRSQSYAMFPRGSVAKTHQKPAVSHNDKVRTAGPVRATPQKPFDRDTFFETPQRVPIKKSLATPEFQTDPFSLPSILHNKGVCISSQSSATPRTQSYSMFPQRVSVGKSRQKATASQNKGVKATISLHVTPQKPSDRGTYFGTTEYERCLGARIIGTHKPLHHDKMTASRMKVVQTLFVEQEDGLGPGNEEEQLPVLQASPIKSHCKDKVKMNTIWGNQEAQMIEEAQQSIPTLQRESVIFFPTGEKQLHFEKHESLTCQEQPSQEVSEGVVVCELVGHIKPASHNLHRDQKALVTNTALALLPNSVSAIVDLRLDQEVAFYTSHSLVDVASFLPSQHRCRDPVAFLRHFEESTTFLPLSLTASSLCSSPFQEKE
ncbi:uncharacterized protein troap isoform X2 [Syngnathoides biaculeatus]|uniref:uncharacterized protein troap isoform X2 n=1 Tax=Syngnathoides biaculeatus TaxID=300417 RepID=UPI002ADDE5F2|nr:uncharacterized protein troap isoform X2 [Syngnathoides biaculeatus]